VQSDEAGKILSKKIGGAFCGLIKLDMEDLVSPTTPFKKNTLKLKSV
jgi:hypothetical protein